MKEINLKKGKVALVDDEDFEMLKIFKWWFDGCYAATMVRGRKYRLHRFLVARVKGLEVDHIDRNKLNNQKSNLRLVTRQQNAANTGLRKNNTHGYKGVRQMSGSKTRWQAQIGVGGRCIVLGAFASKEEAARAYDAGAKLYFGDSAALNFPMEGVTNGANITHN